MNDSNVTLSAAWTYSLSLVASSSLLGFLLYSIGASMGCIVPAIVAVAAVISQRAFLLAAMPFVVFATLSITLVFDRMLVFDSMAMSSVESLLLGITGLTIIATAGRVQSIMHPSVRQVITQRVAYTPAAAGSLRQFVAPSHLISLLLFLVAWFAAGYLVADFNLATSNPQQFERYRLHLKQNVGLVPWAYLGIQLVVLLGLFFSVVHGVLSYLRCRNNDGMMAAMLLRHELWRWNGSEQRMIAKALRNRD